MAVLALAFGIAGARTQDKVAGVTAIVIGSLNIFLSIIYSLFIYILLWFCTTTVDVDFEAMQEPLETFGVQSVIVPHLTEGQSWYDTASEDTPACDCRHKRVSHAHRHFDAESESDSTSCTHVGADGDQTPQVSGCVYATEPPVSSTAEDGSQITWHLVDADNSSTLDHEQTSYFQSASGEFIVPLQTPFM